MATIKLKGDTSGEISLTTPATLSNGTLTIPDVTGSVITSADTGSISTTMLADNSVTNAKIESGAVGETELATNAVTNAKVADDAIGIAELSATGSPSSSTYLRGDNTWASISSGGVTYLGQATLSGNSTSISGLSLSGYKFLAVTVYNAAVNSGNNRVYLSSNNASSGMMGFAQEYNSGLASNAGINGSVFVDLATGAYSPPNSDEPTMAYIPSASRILNSTTTIYFRWSGGASFTSGTMRVYGVS